MKALSREPVATAEGRYCAPFCGRGCTKAEHDAAVEAGDALAARLGPGWVPVVWENLGWHYAAKMGSAAVHPQQVGGKVVGGTCYLNFEVLLVVISHQDPRVAVDMAKERMSRNITSLVEKLAEVR